MCISILERLEQILFSTHSPQLSQSIPRAVYLFILFTVYWMCFFLLWFISDELEPHYAIIAIIIIVFFTVLQCKSTADTNTNKASPASIGFSSRCH